MAATVYGATGAGANTAGGLTWTGWTGAGIAGGLIGEALGMAGIPPPTGGSTASQLGGGHISTLPVVKW